MDLSVILRHSAALHFPKGECRINEAAIEESEIRYGFINSFKGRA